MKRALLVGIDHYNKIRRLSGCVNDASAMREVLVKNEDGSRNYDCELLVSSKTEITRGTLRKAWEQLVEFDGDVLFYFSGHGAPTKLGGYVVTQEGTPDDPGLRMNDIVELSRRSKARQILVIIDCCFSGATGNTLENEAQLREGVTILAASRSTEPSMEVAGHGVFTNLVLGALAGGAADIRGNVSAASIYAYVEAALGAWDQRPLYKSHASRLEPIRRCKPPVSDELLRELPQLFSNPECVHHLDPSYEHTEQTAKPENVRIFNKFKILRNARLLFTVEDEDLYYAALHSTPARLTPLGQFYWQLANQTRL